MELMPSAISMFTRQPSDDAGSRAATRRPRAGQADANVQPTPGNYETDTLDYPSVSL